MPRESLSRRDATVIVTSNVVLMARVDDPLLGDTVATYSTIQPVQHEEGEAAARIVEYALEIADDVKNWQRY